MWDASGSGARRDHARELAVLDGYFKALRDVSVHLIVGRDVAEAPRRFPVRGGRWDELRHALAGLAYDGATNLAALSAPADCDLALLFSDGLDNWRPVGAGENRVPLYALSAATSVDSLRLRALAQHTGGEWLDLSSQTTGQVVAALQVRKARLLGMRGNGLHELVSASLHPENNTLTVAGLIRVEQADLELEFGFSEARTWRQRVRIVPRLTSLRATDDGPAVLGQRWAALRVAELDANFEQNRAEIRRLGKAFGLLTRATSLIVLDNAPISRARNPSRKSPRARRQRPVPRSSSPSGNPTRRTPDALRAASAETVYRQYLDERAAFANSTAFFLDAADVLFERVCPAWGCGCCPTSRRWTSRIVTSCACSGIGCCRPSSRGLPFRCCRPCRGSAPASRSPIATSALRMRKRSSGRARSTSFGKLSRVRGTTAFRTWN